MAGEAGSEGMLVCAGDDGANLRQSPTQLHHEYTIFHVHSIAIGPHYALPNLYDGAYTGNMFGLFGPWLPILWREDAF